MMKSILRRILTIAWIGSATMLGGCSLDGGMDNSIMSDWFGLMMPPTPGEAARDAFNIYDADKRRRSVNLLAASPFGMEPPYVRLYRVLLTDEHDPSVRAACAKALGMHGSADDVAVLTPLLADESAFVRWEAAKALQRLHHEDAIAPLRRTLSEDEDADVRMAAANALGQYPSPAVFDTLLGALTDANFGVALASRQSLTTLTGQSHGPDPSDWMDWADLHRTRLFVDAQPYVYYPYDAPHGTLDKIKFWENRPPVQPRTPTGLQPAATHAIETDKG